LAPALYAVRELGFAAWMTIQDGCDNSCAFCIVPSVRGKEISRPFEDLIDEATMLAGLGRERNHRARPERQLLRARHHRRRPLFAICCARWARYPASRRIRFTRSSPEDLRPETIAAMAEDSERL